jgi:predicted alpha-1,2-mannosidase
MNNPGDYTEANAWQYTLTPALHDPQGLARLMGGPTAFGDWLDQFFSIEAPHANKHLGQEAMIGQYSHGNEPSHHIAYLYAYSDRPWKGHAMIRRIAQSFYGVGRGDIQGNDDCGQMSAWYVLSTLGFYPVVPASGEFVAGAPQVRAARLWLAPGKTLLVQASALSERNVVTSQVTLEGRVLDPKHLPYADLMQGGRLSFSMTPRAD